jgi:hypothetical protein
MFTLFFFLTGRCWMDALELTMKCSKLLKKPYSTSSANEDSMNNSQILINPPMTTADNSFLSTSFSDNEFEMSRRATKEGYLIAFFFCLPRIKQ